MALQDKSAKENFTRGADVFFHRMHMFAKNITRATLVALTAGSMICATLFIIFTTEIQREAFITNRLSALLQLFFLPRIPLTFYASDGSGRVIQKTLPARDMRTATESLYLDAKKELIAAMLGGGIGGLLVASSTAAFLIRRGRKLADDEFLRGGKIVDAKDLAKRIDKPSVFKLGNVPIPQNRLTRNIACFGAQGVGKSQAIMHMMDSARANNIPCVVYDSTGEFTEFYYRPGIDHILNPLDARCVPWSIFADLEMTFDYSMAAAYFVPEKPNTNNPEFDVMAREFFEDLLRIVDTGTVGPRSLANLQKIANSLSLEELELLLREHDGKSAGAIKASNPKTAESIRFSMKGQQIVTFLEYLQEPPPNSKIFSIREWAKNPNGSWLFLPSDERIHKVAKPFISLWLELVLSAAMELRPVRGERTNLSMMLFIDELASLGKLDGLETALTRSSKFGISTIVGMQSVAQGRQNYGPDLWDTLLGNLQNKLVLRVTDFKTAEEYSKILGKEEIMEVSENTSMGAEASRDGVALNNKRTPRELVMPSEIIDLPDLVGFVKLAGMPTARNVVIDPRNRSVGEPGFIPRSGLRLKHRIKGTPSIVPAAPETKPESDDVSSMLEAEEVADILEPPPEPATDWQPHDENKDTAAWKGSI